MTTTILNDLSMALLACGFLAGCGGDGGGGGDTAGTVTAAAVVERYADVLHANYEAIEAGVVDLQGAVESFVAAPSAATLQAAKDAWLAARPAYQESEMARFYDGPIDNPVDGPEGRINAWPLDESYVDYVEGAPDAGIVNDPAGFPVITAAVLAGANEIGGEENVATGWHAIEFLLWGQDRDVDGPGTRPFTDYVADGSGTHANQARRATYLTVITALLLDDVRGLVAAWASGTPDNFRAAFLAADPNASLSRILTGLGTLSGGELAGERMSVAFETRDQEDEHSCFSDNTHIDHRFDQIGIMNAYLGRFAASDGPGIDDLLRQVDPALEAQLTAELEASLVAIMAIPVPFDQAFLGADAAPGRQAISAAIDALFAQTDSIAAAAAALGLDVSTTL
jgi:putative iron-regulated protein